MHTSSNSISFKGDHSTECLPQSDVEVNNQSNALKNGLSPGKKEALVQKAAELMKGDYAVTEKGSKRQLNAQLRLDGIIGIGKGCFSARKLHIGYF